jgi:hypothetical protein
MITVTSLPQATRLITLGYYILQDSGAPTDSRAAGETIYREVEAASAVCI